MTKEEFVEELDLALAALRRVVLKVANIEPTAPVTLVSVPAAKPQEPKPSVPQGRAHPKPRLVSSQKSETPPPAVEEKYDLALDVTYNGVRVDLNTNAVMFRGEKIVVPRRHAQVIAVLARAMPNVMPRDAIISRAWPDLATSSGYTLLSQSYQEMRQSLAKIGLKLNDVPRFGFALCVADDGECDNAEA